jgi:hypothetical protein
MPSFDLLTMKTFLNKSDKNQVTEFNLLTVVELLMISEILTIKNANPSTSKNMMMVRIEREKCRTYSRRHFPQK